MKLPEIQSLHFTLIYKNVQLPIDEFKAKLKAVFLNKVDSMTDSGNFLSVTKNGAAFVISDNAIVMKRQKGIDAELEEFLKNLIEFLETDTSLTVQHMKVAIEAEIEGYSSTNLWQIGTDEEIDLETVSTFLDQKVQTIGSIVMLNIDTWNYKIEIIPPAKNAKKSIRLKLESSTYIEFPLSDIVGIINNHNDYLCNKFAQRLINYC
ncbi:hypothetical protein ACTID9_21820 [Brevibacillus fluminis]|uniref:hypothetical protein n=1 Tax=Brevibacillus fluminis TaxID=511487 RepID=UPI003F8A9E79